MTEPEPDAGPPPDVPAWRRLADLVAAALIAGTAALLAGGIVGAFVTPGGFGTTARLELLARVANPTTATMILAGVAVPAVADRLMPVQGFGARLASLGSLLALVVALLGVNAVLLDITTGDRSVALRISLVVFRLGTLIPAGLAVWLGAAAEMGVSGRARPGSPPPAAG